MFHQLDSLTNPKIYISVNFLSVRNATTNYIKHVPSIEYMSSERLQALSSQFFSYQVALVIVLEALIGMFVNAIGSEAQKQIAALER